MQYTFMKDGVLEVFTIKGVQKGMPIPSITDNFIAAFVFENEIHDLFGVEVRNIAIDFKGNFYAVAQREPMTIISPAQKAARDKAKKAAAAKAERARQAAETECVVRDRTSVCEGEGHGRGSFRRRCRHRAEDGRRRPREDRRVKAALAAKAKRPEEAEAAKPQVFDEQLEAKLAAMDPEKAAKVRTAMARNAKLADMDPEKAAQVRGALTNEAKLESQRAVGQQRRRSKPSLRPSLPSSTPSARRRCVQR